MSYTIRKMETTDIKQVQEVAKTSWNATYEGIIPLDIQMNFLNAAYSDERMNRRLKLSSLYVVEVDDAVVGFANFSPLKEDRTAELGAIYLLPAHQGKGIGTALLQEGIQNLKNATSIFINVEKENKIGCTFYEARGFKEVSEFDDNLEGHISRMVRMVLKV